jgi:hypothetical protein
MILAIPSLQVIRQHPIHNLQPVRSICIIDFDCTHIFVSLGDGTLFDITFTADLSTHKKNVIGTTEADLKRVSMNGKEHVFVCCDRPCVISLDRARITYSNINFQVPFSDF